MPILKARSPKARDTASSPITRLWITIPPARLMRSVSSSRDGLWSCKQVARHTNSRREVRGPVYTTTVDQGGGGGNTCQAGENSTQTTPGRTSSWCSVQPGKKTPPVDDNKTKRRPEAARCKPPSAFAPGAGWPSCLNCSRLELAAGGLVRSRPAYPEVCFRKPPC